MITFIIDELTPCLKHVLTGDIIETEVIRIKRKSFLSKFNKKTGWYVNWGDFPKNVEIYALVLKGTVDIQGLIAIENDKQAEGLHILWAVTAPHNNKYGFGSQEYSGVGGHLFAIAIQKSLEWGYGGFLNAEAMNSQILEYYVTHFKAIPIPLIHPYHFVLYDEAAKRILEVYDYDWSEEEIL